jgi:hypothetical protein
LPTPGSPQLTGTRVEFAVEIFTIHFEIQLTEIDVMKAFSGNGVPGATQDHGDSDHGDCDMDGAAHR